MTTYVRPAIKPKTFRRWTDAAHALGYGQRGARERLLEVMLDIAEENPALFRRR